MGTRRMVDPQGVARDVPEEDVSAAIDAGFHTESNDEAEARLKATAHKEQFGGVSGKLITGVTSGLSGASFGLSDVLAGAVGLGPTLSDFREENPGLHTGASLAGAVLTAIPTGGGSLSAATGSVGSRIASGGIRTAGEGALMGAGQAIGDVAISKQPADLERYASAAFSGGLHGGLTGGILGAAGKAAQIGLSRAGEALAARAEGIAARNAAEKAGNSFDDIERLAAAGDRKALRALKDTEIVAAKEAQVATRKSIADDILAHKAAVDDAEIFLATKTTKNAAGEVLEELPKDLRVLAKRQLDIKKRLDSLTDNTKGLGQDPKKALDVLQRQEDVLTKLDDVRVRAADPADPLSTTLNDFRKSKLEGVPAALERNRALQSSLEAAYQPATSARLAAVEEAIQAAGDVATKPRSALENIVTGSVFGQVASMVGNIALPGAGMAAPFIAGKVSDLASRVLFGRLSKVAGAAESRTASAAQLFLKGASKAAQYAPPVATRVLSKVNYSQDETTPTSRRDLASLYKARTDEIKQQTMFGPDGRPVLRPEVREQIGKSLAPVAVVDPLAADKLETIAARRIEYLSSIIPRKPDIMGLQLSGPDKWQPSDMEMRSFARSVAAIEDPVGVFERASSGSVTSEDAKALQAVYPEMLRDWTTQVMTAAAQAKKPVPYKNRVALSILTGQPLDPSLAPHILSALQQSFAAEPGTEEGTQAPTPQPQFGSVKADSVSAATPSQERAL